jgi:Zn-dependent protease
MIFDDLGFKLMMLAIVLGSITLHEFAHAKSADAAGDPTPRLYGRVTLNPIAHFDPLGFIFILITTFAGIGFGWGKPVPVDPRRMHNPRWDHILVVAWGPFTNCLIALTCALAFRLIAHSAIVSPGLFDFFFMAVLINVVLAAFNLIPLFPLDGSWIVAGLLPELTGFRFLRWNRQFGPMLLISAILILPALGFHPLSYLTGPIVQTSIQVLLGVG